MEKLVNLDLIEGAAEAAAFTGLSRRQIYRLVELGHLPTVRMGRRLYFRKSELDQAFRALTYIPIGFGRDGEWPENLSTPSSQVRH